jgi:Na+-transporting methylmalonyl-CoA/oxaloacetate decarboxylase gamma subunit
MLWLIGTILRLFWEQTVTSQKRANMLKEIRLMSHALAVALVFAVGYAPTAHAYIDPGSGSFVLQVLGIFFAGMLFYFRQFIYQGMELVRKVMRRMTKRKDPCPTTKDIGS